MNTRIEHLRIKIKTLAAEARIIRHAEDRAHRRGQMDLRESLCNHRREDVRAAARISLLALALLRDVPYSRLETSTRRPLRPEDWATVVKTAERFSAPSWELSKEEQADRKARYDAWLEEAKKTATRVRVAAA